MKIIYIVNTLMPTDKAHGYQIGKTCEKFAFLGNSVELWVPNRKNHISDDLFIYYGLERNFKVKKILCPDVIFLSRYVGALAFYLQTLFFSVKLLLSKIEKGSLIYSRDVFSVFVFRLRGFDVVYNAHNWSKKVKWFIRIFLSADVKIICNSEGTKRQIMRDGFHNLIAVPNGVDLNEFYNIGDKLEIRKKLGLPLDKKIAMYVGHLYEWKGVGVILESAKALSKRKDITFVILGGDKEENKEYSAKIESEDIKNVSLLGHKLKSDIPKYLKSADVLLLPNIATTEESIHYTSPIKMFEYMASGVPIIASNLPSIREVLNKENSFLIEPNNSKALAIEVEKLLNEGSHAEGITHCALNDVKKYTWDAYARKILDFIAIK